MALTSFAAVQQFLNQFVQNHNINIAGAPHGAFWVGTAASISTMTWSSGTVTVTTSSAHGYPTGDVLELVIAGVTPSGYNGTFRCTITGATTFTYALTSTPGTVTVEGTYQPTLGTTYNNFINGNVPNVQDPNGNPVPILNKIGGKYDGPSSNIVMVLAGTNESFPQMPEGGPYLSSDQIQEISDWISAGCPQ
jgi:hypothetical protein